jgi:hypothetical protein
MGHQIIVQPGHDPGAADARFSVFSSVIDGFVLVDATEGDVIAYEADVAAEAAREATARKVAQVRAYAAGEPDPIVHPDITRGRPIRPYAQFTMTYEEAALTHLMHGHDRGDVRGDPDTLVAAVDYAQGRALNADGRCVNCNPDDEDPRAWCDCDRGDYPADGPIGCTRSYVGGACRLLAHDPADCPLREAP